MDKEPQETAASYVQGLQNRIEKRYKSTKYRIREYTYWIQFLSCYLPWFQPSIDLLEALINTKKAKSNKISKSAKTDQAFS